MIQANIDQLIALAKKTTLSTEEKAVYDALIAESLAETVVAETVQPVPSALFEAQDVVEDTQEALVNKPSTTV